MKVSMMLSHGAKAERFNMDACRLATEARISVFRGISDSVAMAHTHSNGHEIRVSLMETRLTENAAMIKVELLEGQNRVAFKEVKVVIRTGVPHLFVNASVVVPLDLVNDLTSQIPVLV